MTTALERTDIRTRRGRGRLFAALPVVLAGSLALAVGASPAEAATKRPVKDRLTPPAQPERPAARTAPTPGARVVTASAPAQAYAPREYSVVEGDTVSDIAARFGLSTASVLALNGLSWKSLIFPGQVLSLNTATTAPVYVDTPLTRYTIVAGDTISGVAAAHGIGTESVLLANGLGRDSVIFPGQSIVLPLPAAAPPDSEVVAPTSPTSIVELSPTMRENAATIVRIGRQLGVPDRGIVVALVVAAQESALHNLDWGDSDSLGLFQQRPSMGWGTPEQILDPVRSIRAFFGGRNNPNRETRGLLDIRDWRSLSIPEAAQAVQISAYPNAYGKWVASAVSWLAQLG